VSISIAKYLVVGRESQRLGGESPPSSFRSSKSVPPHRHAWFALPPGLLRSPLCLPARFSPPPMNRAELSSQLYLMTMTCATTNYFPCHVLCLQACVCVRERRCLACAVSSSANQAQTPRTTQCCLCCSSCRRTCAIKSTQLTRMACGINTHSVSFECTLRSICIFISRIICTHASSVTAGQRRQKRRKMNDRNRTHKCREYTQCVFTTQMHCALYLPHINLKEDMQRQRTCACRFCNAGENPIFRGGRKMTGFPRQSWDWKDYFVD